MKACIFSLAPIFSWFKLTNFTYLNILPLSPLPILPTPTPNNTALDPHHFSSWILQGFSIMYLPDLTSPASISPFSILPQSDISKTQIWWSFFFTKYFTKEQLKTPSSKPLKPKVFGMTYGLSESSPYSSFSQKFCTIKLSHNSTLYSHLAISKQAMLAYSCLCDLLFL